MHLSVTVWDCTDVSLGEELSRRAIEEGHGDDGDLGLHSYTLHLCLRLRLSVSIICLRVWTV